jgi:HAD superfamily hydrolase (TIGR01509 family)
VEPKGVFEAVIFDWDGTLADTRLAIVKSFQKALGEMKLKVSDEFIERRIGIGADETFREILRASRLEPDDTTVRHLIDEKNRAEIDMGNKVELFAGATKLLESLHGKVKLALASMNSREIIDHLTKAKKVDRFFDVVLTADEVQHSKPNPEIFLKTAFKLGVKPEKCVVVEDSIFGVRAAKAAKMDCVAVLTGVYSREELERANPDLVAGSLKENKILSFILR